jgi:uncharacterized membrane protein YgcG
MARNAEGAQQMTWLDWGPLTATVIASLLVAVIVLAIRITVMQRVQSRRQRENRQETERLKAMIAAYRALAGSFSPAQPGDRQAQEEALADLVLFGTPRQVELAATCARALAIGALPETDALVRDLRADIRDQLGLDPIPTRVELPASGPGRMPRRGDGEGRAGGSGSGGSGGGGGGGGAGMAGVGGVGIGIAAADSSGDRGA